MNIFKFFKDVSREMRKVTWPRGPELASYTVTVVFTVAFVAVFFAIIDLGITQILNNMPFLNN
ncbi:MAG TPA: preprotein translocase subunit SecE [Pseudogracilibacillus sp.]|nr:preprotein translocase subunit SecE [Pseudogracilibacillus sp.]